jgi:hypothetical protein
MKFLSILLLVLGLSLAACEDDTDVETPNETAPADVVTPPEPDAGTTEEGDTTAEEGDTTAEEEADTTATEDVVETEEEVTETETDVEEPEPEETPGEDPTEFKETNFRFSTPTPGSPGGDD